MARQGVATLWAWTPFLSPYDNSGLMLTRKQIDRFKAALLAAANRVMREQGIPASLDFHFHGNMGEAINFDFTLTVNHDEEKKEQP